MLMLESRTRFFYQLSTNSYQPASQLLREEKDEASLPICFQQGSLNAFIPRFAEDEGVFVSPPRPRPRPRPRLTSR